MKYEYLKTLTHLSILEKDFFAPGQGDGNQNLEAKFEVTSRKEGSTLALTRKTNGAGVWIPYRASLNVFGYLSHGSIWAASGPYSGCVFEVGLWNGRVYIAHLSREGVNQPNIAGWANTPGKTVLFTKRIVMGANATAAITFAHIQRDNIAVTQVDIDTLNAGGMSGPIKGVTQLVTDVRDY